MRESLAEKREDLIARTVRLTHRSLMAFVLLVVVARVLLELAWFVVVRRFLAVNFSLN